MCVLVPSSSPTVVCEKERHSLGVGDAAGADPVSRQRAVWVQFRRGWCFDTLIRIHCLHSNGGMACVHSKVALNAKDFEMWDKTTGDYVVEPGNFTLYVGCLGKRGIH